MKNECSRNWIDSSPKYLKKGIPIGHTSMKLSKKNYWHPLMSSYLLGIRHNTAILNSHLVQKNLLQAFYIIALILRKKGHILIVNTNPEYSVLCRNLSALSLQPQLSSLSIPNISYCSYKWIGGTLTNWRQISKSVLTFAKFSQRCERFLVNNNIEFPRYKKIKTYFQGLLVKSRGKHVLAFYDKPDILFVMNPNENKNIIREAIKLHIPVVAFVETNTNIHGITYPIPVNIYAISYIYYCLKKIILMALMYNNVK